MEGETARGSEDHLTEMELHEKKQETNINIVPHLELKEDALTSICIPMLLFANFPWHCLLWRRNLRSSPLDTHCIYSSRTEGAALIQDAVCETQAQKKAHLKALLYFIILKRSSLYLFEIWYWQQLLESCEKLTN